MEMKQNKAFSMEHIQIWHHIFFLIKKYENISMTLKIEISQFYY